MTEEAKTKDAPDIVTEAKKRFEKAKEYYSSSRAQAVEDARFALGDSDNGWQWPDKIRKSRETDERVCLTVNLTAQHCNQIINNIRQNRPAVKVSPVDSGADKKTAEILGGLIRNIQVSSASDDAHDVAAEHAVYGGEGYWRVITEYEDETSFDQCIKIKVCPNPAMVYIDPDCKELDKSDAQWGFVFEDITIEQCKREHKGIDPQNWEDGSEWSSKETVRRAEYFYCTSEPATACLLQDGTTALKSALPAGAVVVKERATTLKKWKWCKLVGGHDKPLDETEWLGAYLPIIAVVGKEVNVGGEMVRKGIVRDLKDPARMVNFSYSETVQTLALQNKVPYMAAAEAIEGHEDMWASANIETRAYLPFNAYDDGGNPLPKPERQPPAVMPAAQVQLLQLSTEQMRAASGQQNSNFGIKSEASSGVGIQRLKAQGEIATFHFPDNLSRALRYEAKVLIDLVQKYYDTSRVVRILGLDGKEEHVQLDPEMQGAYQEANDEAGEIRKIFNPTVGKYDVTVDTGPSYQTQRQEGAANLNDLASRNPALMQVAGDLIMQAQDFPMADKLAERLAKTLPPELQDKKDGQQEIPPEVQQQMERMGQQLEQMGQALDQAQAALQQAQTEASSKQSQVQADLDSKLEAARLDAAVTIEKANIDAATKKEIAQLEITSEEELAEMRGYFDLLKAQQAPPSTALTQDVEEEFQPEQAEIPLPKILMRKRIQMMAPSGAMYHGTIHDEPIEQEETIEPPMGD